MKETALYQTHLTLGAKMAPFAGFMMPIQYEGINAEHETVRNSAGVFDVSHMGEFVISGENAFNLVQRITTNDVSRLDIGQIQYSALTNDAGGIVDDLLVYRLEKDVYMLVVNASNIQKDWAWIKSRNLLGAKMEDISDEISLLAVQGPKAQEILQELTNLNLATIPYYSFRIDSLAGIPDVIFSNTGYTGAGGFELYIRNNDAAYAWKQIFGTGSKFGIKPIGLGARDTLRLEMGYCLYGNDINDSTSPLEAGLGWITKFNKDFVASRILLQQKEKGITKKLVGFRMVDKGIPRHDYEIVNEAGQKIGVVTSGTQSPSLKQAIGMGYVIPEFSKPDSNIYIRIRDAKIKAAVCKLPFVEPKVR